MSTCYSWTPIKESKKPFRGLLVSDGIDPVSWGRRRETSNRLTKLVDVWRSNFSDAGSNPAISTFEEHSYLGVLFCVWGVHTVTLPNDIYMVRYKKSVVK